MKLHTLPKFVQAKHEVLEKSRATWEDQDAYLLKLGERFGVKVDPYYDHKQQLFMTYYFVFETDEDLTEFILRWS